MLELRLKQYIREFLRNKSDASVQVSPFLNKGVIVVQEFELEKFIDDLWFFISKRYHDETEK